MGFDRSRRLALSQNRVNPTVPTSPLLSQTLTNRGLVAPSVQSQRCGAEPGPALPCDAMVKLFLSGDVMTGRGVDQILGHPGDPGLWEPYIRDARRYVKLAEAVSGPIPRPVGDVWIWGMPSESSTASP